MSKKYKGKTCAYCGKRKSTSTGDHVVAREFLPVEERGGLPKVPCCENCNNDKSIIEHYTTTILPFGSNTYYAGNMLRDYVSKRIERNKKLKRELNKLSGTVWAKSKNGLLIPHTTLPVKAEPIIKLINYIVRGLAYYHWGTIITGQYSIDVWPAPLEQIMFFRRYVLSLSKENCITGNIGNGCIIYKCTRSTDDPRISVWEVIFYNGLIMTGEGEGGRLRKIYFCVWVGPSDVIKAT